MIYGQKNIKKVCLSCINVKKTVSIILMYIIWSEWPNFKLALRQGHCDISSKFSSHPPKPIVFMRILDR